MTTVFLLRHGALAGDSGERFVGQTDLPLSPAGVCQAEALGRALSDCGGINAVYCSDLLRSRQTAALVAAATGAPVETRSDLREISLGKWEGLSRREVAARFPAQYAARGADIEHYRVPAGESFADARQRALAAWGAILLSGHRRIAVAGHAGINRLLLCHLLGMPLTHLFRLGQDYGGVNVVELDGERILVCLVNGRPADLRPERLQPAT